MSKCNAYAVRAISIANPTEVHDFPSLSSAQVKIKEWTTKSVHSCTIKKYADGKLEGYGYRWERITKPTPNPKPTPKPNHDNNNVIEEVPKDIPDTSVFTFRGCVDAIFNGGQVRVTNEIPRRVSVIDLIRIIVGESACPKKVWQRMQDRDTDRLAGCHHIWQFPGAAQRETPVTDSAGMIMIIHLLPGARARQFRASAVDVLVRYLIGDPTLHDEIHDNAVIQQNLPAQHPLQMLSEEVYANPKSAKYVLYSPTVSNRQIGYFYDKSVVYIIVFEYNCKTYIKVGWSDNLRERLSDHFKELPPFKIYTVEIIDNAYRVEQMWKDNFGAYNEHLTINGKNQTELFTGVILQQAETSLQELCHEERLKSQNGRAYEMKKLEIEEKKLDMAHELEMKRLELQIIQAKQAVA